MASSKKTRSSKPRKSGATKSHRSKTGEALRKDAIAAVGDNIKRIEAAENGHAAKKTRAAKAPRPAKEKKLSALDAAARVLNQAKAPMNAVDLVKAMAEQQLWTSPGGKTPQSTLYAAMAREIKDKGKESRFTKADRGLFAAA